MEILLQRLNLSKIRQSSNGIRFPEYDNLKSNGIWKLDQKGNLFFLKLSIIMPSLENFEAEEDSVSYFRSWIIEMDWRIQILSPGSCGPFDSFRKFCKLIQVELAFTSKRESVTHNL